MAGTRGGAGADGRGHRDLPVSVELAGVLGEEVAAYVESEAGWQVVAPEGPPPPVLRLAAAPLGSRACVVVHDGSLAAEQVRAALLGGALDVIAWPADRVRLLEAPARVRAIRRAGPGSAVVRVAGASGGAGASTVALALGGLLAWSGRRSLVVGGDDLLRLCGKGPWRGPGAAELAGLDAAGAAAEVEGLAVGVAGVDGLSVLGGGGRSVADAAGWPVDAVVCDLGAGPPWTGPDVVVARPDAARVRGGPQRARADRRRAAAAASRGAPAARPRAARLAAVVRAGGPSGMRRAGALGAAGQVAGGPAGNVRAGATVRVATARQGAGGPEPSPRAGQGAGLGAAKNAGQGANPEGAGEVTIRDLVRQALRMRPDRIVVGEVRGPELVDVLQALATGHEGCMTTLHARAADEALVRLEGMALLAGLPLPAARAQIELGVDVLVVLSRGPGGSRGVVQVAETVRRGDEGPLRVRDLWRRDGWR